MTPEEAIDLFEYDRWANDRQIAVIVNVPEQDYVRDLGSSYGGLRGTLVHIYAAQQVWTSRWRGESAAALLTPVQIPTIPVLQERWKALSDEISRFTSTLTEQRLNEPFTYKDLKGNTHSQPLAHQIRHVINHSSYHRGQITTMLRQLGIAPPASVDLIAYYRERQAAQTPRTAKTAE